jgi:hypothetical protein
MSFVSELYEQLKLLGVAQWTLLVNINHYRILITNNVGISCILSGG